MDPYLIEVARRLETMRDRDEIMTTLDGLELLYEALEPEQQDLASELIDKLGARLTRLG
jgi:hypothetical protein